MNIGKNIRRFRREKELTQEELAEFLGVSVSAVSQWESADRLLGIDITRKEARIAELRNRAETLDSRGYTDKAYAILSAGLGEYPDSCELMHDLMYAANSLRRDNSLTSAERRKYADEVIRLGERILDLSLDDDLRQGAIQVLCFVLTDLGERKRALELAGRMSCMSCSQEFLLARIFDGDEGDRYSKRLLYYLIWFLSDEMVKPPRRLDSGEPSYNEDEAALIRDKQIELLGLMLEKGDYNFFSGNLSRTHTLQAEYYASRGDARRTLMQLEKAAEHALAFTGFLESGTVRTYDSIMLRGLTADPKAVSVASSRNSARELLDRMSLPAFDFIRKSDSFAALSERLKEYAADWTPAK